MLFAAILKQIVKKSREHTLVFSAISETIFIYQFISTNPCCDGR